MDAVARPSGRSDLRNAELVALIPGLEIIVTRALGGGDDARDVVQETLARAVVALDREREIHVALAAFVHGIAMHVIADVLRARNRLSVSDVDLDRVESAFPNALERLIDAQEQDAMNRALAQLDPEERKLLRRCYVHGEKTSAIADDLGEPAARVRKRKSRALERLRTLLRHTFAGAATNNT